eukprot:COSAG02_NODE_13171_length_1433_cov_2.837331_1_plen_403_part_00
MNFGQQLKLPLVVLLVNVYFTKLCTSHVQQQQDATAEPASHPAHPRLFLTSDRAKALNSSTVTKPFIDALIRQADIIMNAPLITYNFEVPRCSQPGTCLAWGPLNSTTGSLPVESGRLPPVGPLDTATVLQRVATLALAHRLHHVSGDSPYLSVAVHQLEETVGWPSWYWPTGQAQQLAFGMWAVAIGYDWLHNDLSLYQRAALREGLLHHGLLTVRRAAHEAPWWRRDTGSSAGLAVFSATTAACAAIMDDYKRNTSATAMIAAVLEDAQTQLAQSLVSWGPDGVWPEGAADYGLAAQAAALATMVESRGMSGPSALTQQSIAEYQLLSTAPSFMAHNWGDGPMAYAHPASVLMWLANISTDETSRQAYSYAANLQAHAASSPALNGGLLGTGSAAWGGRG